MQGTGANPSASLGQALGHRAKCKILRIDSILSPEDNWPAAVVGTPLFKLVVRII